MMPGNTSEQKRGGEDLFHLDGGVIASPPMTELEPKLKPTLPPPVKNTGSPCSSSPKWRMEGDGARDLAEEEVDRCHHPNS